MSFQIQDYNFVKIATQLTLWLEYRPFATTGTVYVQFQSSTGEVLGTEQVFIPEDVYANWTDSDQVLVDYVFAQLGIQTA
jgi:hypothetical protein